jgi:hypothetical protein
MFFGFKKAFLSSKFPFPFAVQSSRFFSYYSVQHHLRSELKNHVPLAVATPVSSSNNRCLEYPQRSLGRRHSYTQTA